MSKRRGRMRDKQIVLKFRIDSHRIINIKLRLYSLCIDNELPYRASHAIRNALDDLALQLVQLLLSQLVVVPAPDDLTPSECARSLLHTVLH